MSNIEDIEKRAAEWHDAYPLESELLADLDLAIAGWKEERTTAFLATEAARKDALANHDLRRELAQARADLDQLRRDEGRRVVAEAERVRELREARADVRKLRGWLLRIPDSVPHFSYSDELRNDLADTAHHEQVRE